MPEKKHEKDGVDILEHNRVAWNEQVAGGNRWTVPVPHDVVERARRGEVNIYLTPSRPVPREWLPPLAGADVLCLASGGGQQGPILAASGASVTVFDNSDRQLEQDRAVAERERLELRTVRGDMADLSAFGDESFDLIVHPVSNVFAPDILRVWREAHRVLRRGGSLLSGIGNGFLYVFDAKAYEQGRMEVAHSLPYSDAATFTTQEIRAKRENGDPLEFGHTLEEQIGGQIAAGFVLTGFYEDRNDPPELLDRYLASYFVTRATKPGKAGRLTLPGA